MKVTLSSEEVKEAISQFIKREYGIDNTVIFENAVVENRSIANNYFNMLESIRDIEVVKAGTSNENQSFFPNDAFYSENGLLMKDNGPGRGYSLWKSEE